MMQEEILNEINKCRESPYYFATTYLKVKNHWGEYVAFTTCLTEKEFNQMFNERKLVTHEQGKR